MLRASGLSPGMRPAGELIHIPFYEQQAVMRGRRVDLAVEACSGRVYGDRLPPGARVGDGGEGFNLGLALLGFVAMFLERPWTRWAG